MLHKNELFPIGQITKSHGLKGELAFSTNFSILEDTEVPFVILEPEGLLVPFYIENVRMKSDSSGLLKLERVDSDEQARQYIGQTIYLPKVFLEEVEEDDIATEYFIGFELIDNTKGTIGKITDIEQSTANILFVIESDEGEILIPAADEYVTDIDHDQKILRVTLPEGLVDL